MELAQAAAAAGASLVIAAGGDGTINEVLNGLVGTATPMAILPAGTASVLAMEMRLGKDLLAVARRLPTLVPRRVAVGRFTPDQGTARHFLLMAGAGLDASVCEMVNPELKRRAGKLAYWWAGLRTIGRRLPQMEARTGDVISTTGFALAARVRNYGGDLELAKRVTLLDDTFEFAFFSGKTTLPFGAFLGAAALGQLARMPGVRLVRGHSLHLRPVAGERIPVQLDGELAGHLPAAIEIVPDALTLLTPADLPARYGR
jgi:diacylglycerol kinase (ATP)